MSTYQVSFPRTPHAILEQWQRRHGDVASVVVQSDDEIEATGIKILCEDAEFAERVVKALQLLEEEEYGGPVGLPGYGRPAPGMKEDRSELPSADDPPPEEVVGDWSDADIAEFLRWDLEEIIDVREEQPDLVDDEPEGAVIKKPRPIVVQMASQEGRAKVTTVVFFERVGKKKFGQVQIVSKREQAEALAVKINSLKLPKFWEARVRELTREDNTALTFCAHRMDEPQSEGYFFGSQKMAQAIADILNGGENFSPLLYR